MTGFRPSRWWVAVGLVAVAVASCSSGKNQSSTTASTAPKVAFTVRLPEDIAPPAAQGKGMNVPQPAPKLPPGYTEKEFLVGGTATSFSPRQTPDDGRWTATPAKTAKYRTRVIVRTPPAAKFSGTVVVEWFNVSAIESDPDWAYLSEEIGREGDAYIGVSAQAQGVEGGKTILNVNVDKKAASSLGKSADKSGLKHIDPVRYGTLVHPGDAYAFDIFSQIGKAAKDSPAKLLGQLKPKRVIAIGESQSAAFMTTLVNAIHPLDPVFSGFMIHSRGSGAIPVDGKLGASGVREASGRGVLVRTDLNVPVFLFETETDLTLLGYSQAQQPDTQFVHTWEVAGTSHADAHLLRVVVGGPRNPNVGSLLGCTTPINTGPQHEVLQAALHQVVRWVAGGAPPATATPLQVVEHDGQEATIARDAHGNALGGVRDPLVDVPVVTLTGEPPAGTTIADVPKANGTCLLFGKTTPFDHATLVSLYGTADNYVAKFRESANKAVSEGFLLRPDADALIAEAEGNRALFG